MSKHKKKCLRFIIHYVKPTAQLLFRIRFPKGGPTCRGKVVNPRHQTPQGQSVAKPETPLQNIQYSQVNYLSIEVLKRYPHWNLKAPFAPICSCILKTRTSRLFCSRDEEVYKFCISVTNRPIQMNEHFYFIAFKNIRDGSIVSFIIMCKVSMLLIHMYIKTGLHINGKFPYAPIYRRLTLNPRTGRYFCSSGVQVYKALYLSHQTTGSNEWTLFFVAL